MGVWMYSMNHPRLFVLADVVRAIPEREEIEAIPDPECCHCYYFNVPRNARPGERPVLRS